MANKYFITPKRATFIRMAPDKSSPNIGVAYMGSEFGYAESAGADWFQVKVNGKICYVPSEDMRVREVVIDE